MEATHQPDNHTLLSIVLASIGFLTEIARRLIESYDVTFKLLTLAMLALAVLVNLDKAAKVLVGYAKALIKWIRKN